MNKIEEMRYLELQCECMISIIGLHRGGVKEYDDVLSMMIILKNILETHLSEAVKERWVKKN